MVKVGAPTTSDSMDKGTIPPPELYSVDTEDETTFEETMLRAACMELVAQGLKGKRLMAELFARNERFPDPVSRDFIYVLCAQYQDPIEAVIDSDDVKELFKIAPVLALLSGAEYGIALEQIKEKFGKRVNLNDLKHAVKDELRQIKVEADGEKRDVADIARDWASSHRDAWAYDTVYDVWRMWNGSYWEEQPKKHLLDKEAVAALQDAEETISTQAGLNLFERLAEADCIRDFKSLPGLINFANGTLERATGQLRGYSKDDNLTYCLPYGYNPYGSHPNIDKFLAEVLPDEYARRALMAHGGLALMGDLFMHYFYVLIGSPRSGKTTILALLNALCGVLDPYAFAGHSIFSRDIEGKRARYKWSKGKLTCIDELPAEALREEELLKAMSAHSGVEMRGIGRDEHTDNRWKPKLLMATNDQPRYSDHSSAIKERSLFAEIRQAKPKEEREAKLFADKLYPELGAFAASCLDLAEQVLQRGYYPLSASMKQLIDRIANEGNPLKNFLQEECLIDGLKDTRISSKTMHEAYEAFCNERGHTRIMAQNTLSMTLRTMHPKIDVPPQPFWIDSKKQRGMRGIRLRTSEDPEGELFYSNDPPLVERCQQAQKETVDVLNEPVEGVDGDMSTMSTGKESYSTCSKQDIPYTQDSQGISPPIERVGEKIPLTSLTWDANEPIERGGHVNGYKSAPLTSLTEVEEFDL